ncbi:hypothetical protein [Candidatus Pantoea formicae]|uniref:hypothetical protein n=1 Tax=Candidatus Pantoea formicae TaxID=2608355 RepID=UPI003EDA3690
MRAFILMIMTALSVLTSSSFLSGAGVNFLDWIPFNCNLSKWVVTFANTVFFVKIASILHEKIYSLLSPKK